MEQWMKIKPLCAAYGVPESVVQNAVHSDYKHQVGRKAKPDKPNSPWLINVKRTLKLFKEGRI